MVVIFAVLGGGIYLLFFGPVPAIERVIPSQLKSTIEISSVNFRADLDEVAKQLPPQGKLRRYVGDPSVGESGRINPFFEF